MTKILRTSIGILTIAALAAVSGLGAAVLTNCISDLAVTQGGERFRIRNEACSTNQWRTAKYHDCLVQHSPR